MMPSCKACNKRLKRRDAIHCVKHRYLSWTEESKNKLLLGLKRRSGKRHHLWKGNAVSYRGMHAWVVRKLGQPSTCTKCGRTGLKGREIQWANISGKYKRVISDWKRMCRNCHMKMDAAKRRRNKRKKYES